MLDPMPENTSNFEESRENLMTQVKQSHESSFSRRDNPTFGKGHDDDMCLAMSYELGNLISPKSETSDNDEFLTSQ